MIEQIIQGFLSPMLGLRVILSSPRNMLYALIPFGIGLLVVLAGSVAGFQYVNQWVQAWTDGFSSFQDWSFLKTIVDALLILVSWIVVSLLNFLAAYLCIIVLAGPFYALMVENIFKKELPDKEQRSDFRLVVGMFFLGLLKAVIFLCVGILCFILSWIPGFNLLAPLIVTLTVAFDCSDYAFEVDFLGLRERFQFFASHIWNYFGLGLAILVTGLIPGAFFILLPVFVCGATKMYIQLQTEKL
jgi:CysZ protein